MRRNRWVASAGLALACLPWALAAGAQEARPAPDPFAECESAFARDSADSRAASHCFVLSAQRHNLWGEAARRLEALRARHPDVHWLTLSLGSVRWSLEPDRAEQLYRTAADGFAAQGNATGEVVALQNLHNLLQSFGELEEAGSMLDRLEAVAAAAADPLLEVRALTSRAKYLTDTGQNLGRAYRLYRRAEAAAFPGGPYVLKKQVLWGLGDVCVWMGRFGEAVESYRRLEVLAREAEDRAGLAAMQFNIANALLEQQIELPRSAGREEVLAVAREAMASAEATGDLRVQAVTHRLVGELLAATDEGRRQARHHHERCVELAEEIQAPTTLSECLWYLAALLAESDPLAAQTHAERAIAVARDIGHSARLAHAWRYGMRVRWATGSREEAIADSLAALAAIEALRSLQEESGARAELLSAWTRDYYWLSGRLLEGADGPGREDLELAFAVTERMRARVLYEVLQSADAAPTPPASHPLVIARRRTLEQIVAVHRRLLDPDLDPDDRVAALASLEQLELEELEAREELARGSLGYRGSAPPEFATLRQVEASLAPDEALLSFQVGLWEDVFADFGGGAWLLVSTTTGTQAHRLPGRLELEAILPVYLGLFEGTERVDGAATARLYRDLIGDAIADLPPSVDRLVLVPDGRLHQIPFAALRQSDDAPLLIDGFELSIAPSASLWLHWKRSPPPRAEIPALVLADPTPQRAGRSPRTASMRGAAWSAVEPLGALPRARQEGRATVRHLGGASELLVGEAASERFLKQTDLGRYRILHFAAHAVVDGTHPERSAVVLAPGAEGEDGLLQNRDIVDLDLEGQVVVLSACRSATGTVLRGEGVLGLARAFFQAGAQAVVGSLWRLRDDHATFLFDVFYRRIGDGQSVGAALRGAQMEGVRAGLPVAAWASLVVVGDGGVTPLPNGRHDRPRSMAAAAAVVIALGVLALLVLARRSHRRDFDIEEQNEDQGSADSEGQ